jgi:hypothetical protein
VEAEVSGEIWQPNRNASPLAQQHIAFLEVSAAGAQAFDLPALQGQARFVVFLDEIFMIRLLVAGDLSVAGWFFAHDGSI